MKIIFALLLALAVLASEEEVLPVTEETPITISKCHEFDPSLIHVIPIPKNAVRKEGWFVTTNTVLQLSNLSMLPGGLCRLEVRTICRGMTGEVSTAVFDLRRPPPAPALGIQYPKDTNAPPLPPGATFALPNGATNFGALQDLELMKRYHHERAL